MTTGWRSLIKLYLKMRLISADSSRVVHYKIIVVADLNVSYEQRDQLSVNFDPSLWRHMNVFYFVSRQLTSCSWSRLEPSFWEIVFSLRAHIPGSTAVL